MNERTIQWWQDNPRSETFPLTHLNAIKDLRLSPVATTGNYNDLDNTPTNVSAFTNDAGYLTEQSQVDWEESDSTSPSYIQHKPDIQDMIDNTVGNINIILEEINYGTV